MDQIDELRTLVGPVLGRIEKDKADRIEQLLSRMEKTAALQERKLNRAILDRQAVHSLMKKTSEDLMRRYRIIFEHAGNPMIVIEKDGMITLANTLFCQLAGEDRDALENLRNICDYLAGDACDPLLETSEAAGGAADEIPLAAAGRIHIRGGGARDILISIGTFPGSSQRIVTFVEVTERLRLEQKLVETSNFLTGILKASPVGFHMTDPGGRLVYINERWIAVTGYPSDAVMGKYYADIVHPEDRDRVVRDIREHAGRSEPMVTETRIVKPDGTIRWILGHTVPLSGPDGKLTGWVGAVSDITERRAAEEALRKSENRFREMADLLPQVIFEMDTGGRMTYLNRFGFEMFGITEDALLDGLDAFSYLVPSDRDRAKDRLSLIASGRAADTSEIYTFRRTSGNEILAYIHAAPILREGILMGFRGSVIDITALKHIEAALREREEMFRALTENIPELIFSAGVDMRITYVSPQVRLFGFSAGDMLGKDLFSFYHPGDREKITEQFCRDLHETSRSSLVFRILDRSEDIHWVEQKVTMIRDEKGDPLTIFGILHDITDRKKAEAAIELANRKLNLMNNITRHDILNTVTGTLGCIDMFRAGVPLEEKDQLLTDIRELVRVIQRQITFTREYQEVGIHMPRWQNLGSVITAVETNFEKIPFAISARVEDVEVYADPLFEKVIYNLIDNAVRYAETATKLIFTGRRSGKIFVLTCEDNGNGISSDQKERIFERGIGRNTGMGLFLTREILEITGISIRETGTPGKGARFEIRIPQGNFRVPDPEP
jgi:PAS domain S-box-containing protein